MKPRDPYSVAAAVVEVVDLVQQHGRSRQEAWIWLANSTAAASGYRSSVSLVKKWADQDCEQWPNALQLFALEELALELGAIEGPIAKRLRLAQKVTNRPKTTLARWLAGFTHKVNSLYQAKAAATDPESPGGEQVTPFERADIQVRCLDLEDHLTAGKALIEDRAS